MGAGPLKRRRPLALTAAVAVALAGGAVAQPVPGRQPTPDHLRVLQQQTRDFESRFRPTFPPPRGNDAERRVHPERKDRDGAEQDRSGRDLPWSATPWSDGRWSR